MKLKREPEQIKKKDLARIKVEFNLTLDLDSLAERYSYDYSPNPFTGETDEDLVKWLENIARGTFGNNPTIDNISMLVWENADFGTPDEMTVELEKD